MARQLNQTVGLLLVALVVVGTMGVEPAAAHQPGSTLVTVAAVGGGSHGGPVLELVGQIPADELDIAYDTDFEADTQREVDERRGWLIDESERLVHLVDPDGQDWSLTVDSVTIGEAHDAPTVDVVLHATPPPESTDDEVTLRWEVVTEVVYSHKVHVGGVDADETAQYLGILTHYEPEIALHVDAPGEARAEAMFDVGWSHFREGPDHLLFLCLVALGALRRRDGWKRTLVKIAGLTAMFTVGHSLSLALASLDVISVPTRWVEVAIAATILLAAVYAIRPTLPFRVELGVTGAFGLIHGFGFAAMLAEIDVTGSRIVVPLLTFNLGLEVAQLAGLVLVAVPLWLISRSRLVTAAVAAVVGLIAAGWVLERALDRDNPLSSLVDAVAASPERLALVLLVPAAIAAATDLRDRHPAGPDGLPTDAPAGQDEPVPTRGHR